MHPKHDKQFLLFLVSFYEIIVMPMEKFKKIPISRLAAQLAAAKLFGVNFCIAEKAFLFSIPLLTCHRGSENHTPKLQEVILENVEIIEMALTLCSFRYAQTLKNSCHKLFKLPVTLKCAHSYKFSIIILNNAGLTVCLPFTYKNVIMYCAYSLSMPYSLYTLFYKR